jgi:hypothetical protein
MGKTITATGQSVCIGDNVKDPMDGEVRKVIRIDGSTVYMADGGCMSIAECIGHIILDSEFGGAS